MNERSFNAWSEMKITPASAPLPDKTRNAALTARRQMILEAAVMCFLENGFHQTGVRDIAARAGVSLGNLYNHFPGKHDVLLEIARLERMELDPFIAQLEKEGPAPKRFKKFVEAYAKYLAAPENVILTIEITSEAIRKDDLGELFRQNREALVSALKGLLDRGVENRDFTLPTTSEEAAHMVLELIEGRAYHSVLGEAKMGKLLPGLQSFLNAAIGTRTR
ncbi:TetR/AcrR family transcriptional regulator [Phycobacter sp. K97]|uniref:TetR/AcrR family transcriptional regulator n=1 Tax=Phycobacter sedimenti TaxID=3133977 RepID=UPI00311DC9B0